MTTKREAERNLLILGDVNSGKTQLTVDLVLRERDRRGGGIALLDLAPTRTKGVGGKMRLPPELQHTYYTADIVPPRLSSDDPDKQWDLARRNLQMIEELFASYLQAPSEILAINDVSLYLHAGSVERVLQVMSTSQVALVNGYYGAYWGDSLLSQEEKTKMEELLQRCDRVKQLNGPHPPT